MCIKQIIIETVPNFIELFLFSIVDFIPTMFDQSHNVQCDELSELKM